MTGNFDFIVLGGVMRGYRATDEDKAPETALAQGWMDKSALYISEVPRATFETFIQ